MRTRIDVIVSRRSCHYNRGVGVAVLRIGIAVTVLHILGTNFNNRHYLWGPDGVVPRESGAGPALEMLNPWVIPRSNAQLDVVWGLTVIIAVAVICRGHRIAVGALAYSVIGLIERNPLVTDGGDNLLIILLPMLLLCRSDLYLAWDAAQRRRLVDDDPALGKVIHNAGITLIVFQICVVYAVASYWKLGGELWQDGTALYYIGQLGEFSGWRPMSSLLTHPIVATLATYIVVLLQLAVAPSVATNRGTRLLVPGLIVMHSGIATTMGLASFGVIMISADCFLMKDRDFHQLREYTHVIGRRKGQLVFRSSALPSPRPNASGAGSSDTPP